MKKTSIVLSVLFSLLVMGILILSVIIAGNKFSDQMLFYCWENNFNNVTLKGDFSGELNCLEYYENVYSNGKWSEKCSNWFLSDKTDCHTLCNIDCEYQNKKSREQGGNFICVC